MYVAYVSSTFTSYDKRRVRLFRIRDWILRYRSTTDSANDSAFLYTGSKRLQVFQIHHYVYHKGIGEERKLGVDMELSAGTRTIIFPCWWKGARAESVWRTVTKSLNHNKPGCRSAFARDLSVRLLIVIVEFSRNLPRLEFPVRFALSFHKYQPRASPIRAQFANVSTPARSITLYTSSLPMPVSSRSFAIGGWLASFRDIHEPIRRRPCSHDPTAEKTNPRNPIERSTRRHPSSGVRRSIKRK